ncbi:MAG TPA: LacI family DNA-binding transcriptional regulator [Chloroflexia bacterium]|jgi:DNA-binding LacI/PurR family transcriptional regulator
MTNIHDVARHAGVSISTVSRVLNGNARVNSDVKKRVEAAVEALAYQPNSAARSLRTNRSRIIGLLISDIQNPFFMGLIRGVEDEALRHEYSLILCNSNESPQREQQYLDVLYAERVAGAIIVPTREQLGEEVLRRFQERRIPIVAADRRVKDKSIDAVLVDNVRGAREAVTHLIANGYRRIGVIAGPTGITTGRERLEGYRQALQDAGIPHEPLLERSGTFKVESGQELADELLDLTPAIDALFVGNNLMTLGALKAIQARNLRVPEDLALVGYDDIQWAELGSVSLTTVVQPVYELGSAAALRLFQRLQNPAIQSRQEITLTPSLRVRGSSQPRGGLSLAEGVTPAVSLADAGTV